MQCVFLDIIQARESRAIQPAISLGKLREEIVVGERLRKDEISKSVFRSLSRSSAFPQEAVCCPADLRADRGIWLSSPYGVINPRPGGGLSHLRPGGGGGSKWAHHLTQRKSRTGKGRVNPGSHNDIFFYFFPDKKCLILTQFDLRTPKMSFLFLSHIAKMASTFELYVLKWVLNHVPHTRKYLLILMTFRDLTLTLTRA